MKKTRYLEIDTMRGIAIIGMIFFHILVAMNILNKASFNLDTPGWYIFSKFFASTFIFLVGTSLTLSYAKIKDKPIMQTYKKYLLRGLGLFGLGIGMTVITYLGLEKGVIVFGILHLIGLSIILGMLMVRYNFLNLVLGSLMILAGAILNYMTFSFSYLVWLGFVPQNFYTLDYFPILPWFGVVLLGIAFGNQAYTNGVRQFKLPDYSENKLITVLCFLGRHSLLIYVLHLPIIAGLVYLL